MNIVIMIRKSKLIGGLSVEIVLKEMLKPMLKVIVSMLLNVMMSFIYNFGLIVIYVTEKEKVRLKKILIQKISMQENLSIVNTLGTD